MKNILFFLFFLFVNDINAQVISGSARCLSYNIEKARISKNFPFPTQRTKFQKDSAFKHGLEVIFPDAVFQKNIKFEDVPLMTNYPMVASFSLYSDTMIYYPGDEHSRLPISDYSTMCTFAAGIPVAPELPIGKLQTFDIFRLSDVNMIFLGKGKSLAMPNIKDWPAKWTIPLDILKNKDVEWKQLIRDSDSSDTIYAACIYYRIPPYTFFGNNDYIEAFTLLCFSTKKAK
jgi:hypothetical protein